MKTVDWVSKTPGRRPRGRSPSWGRPGLRAAVPTGAFDSGCRDDLVTVDGDPVTVRVRGDVADAVAGAGMRLTMCGRGVELAAGNHTLRSAVGRDEGIDVDRLVLSSRAADGRQVPVVSDDDAAGSGGPSGPGGPEVTIEGQGRTSATVEVGPRDEPTWFVLGQSNSTGWQATAGGRDLGPPTVIDGYANGWLLPAGADPLTVELLWTPQRVVLGGLVASGIAVIACLVVVVIGLRRRRRPRAVTLTPAGDQPAAFRPSILWRSDGAPPSVRATVVAVLLATAISAAVIGPVAGIVVGAATLAVLRVRRARALTVLGPAVAARHQRAVHDRVPGPSQPPVRVRVAQLLPEGAPGRLRGRRRSSWSTWSPTGSGPPAGGRRPRRPARRIRAGERPLRARRRPRRRVRGLHRRASEPSSRPRRGVDAGLARAAAVVGASPSGASRARGVRPVPPGRGARAPHVPARWPPIPGAAEALWRLSDAGVWIRIITHRLCVNWGHAIAVADTVEWLDRTGIPYRDICFLGRKPEVEARRLRRRRAPQRAGAPRARQRRGRLRPALQPRRRRTAGRSAGRRSRSGSPRSRPSRGGRSSRSSPAWTIPAAASTTASRASDPHPFVSA